MLTFSGVASGEPTAETEVCAYDANQAQVLRDEGKLVEARQRFISCARPVCPTLISTVCARWLNEIGPRIPSVVFRNGAEVGVTIDGHAFSLDESARSIPLNPGPHTARFSAADGRTAQATFTLAEGQKDFLIKVPLPPKAGANGANESERRSFPSNVPAASWLFAGVGVLALGSFTFFAVRGSSHRSDLEATCAPRCTAAERDSLHAELLLADVSLGVGLVSLGIATFLALSK